MKATLRCEYIGESLDAKIQLYSGIFKTAAGDRGKQVVGRGSSRRPWVAEITGIDDAGKLERSFLAANWQRVRANSEHSRGVELWFILEDGRLYEVSRPVSWRRTERFFCVVDQTGTIQRLSQDEANKWLSGL